MGRSYNHWSEAEVTALREGVTRFGVGNWQKIVNDYAVLRHRTGVQLKDKYRNMIKFRHLAGNELCATAAAPQRRSGSSRAVARRSPTPAAAAEAVTDAAAPQLQAVSLQTQQEAQASARSAGASTSQHVKEPQQVTSPPWAAQQRQAQLAAGQVAAHLRLHQAQAAVKPVQQAYVQHLAAAALRRAAAAAAVDEAAAVAATGAPARALQQVAQWQQQQAEMAQQLLLAARQVYLQAAEEAQQAQAAANAAAAAVLQAAETEADRAPMLPAADGHVSAAVVRHSNRRKAALNRKRFLDDEGAEEEPHLRPRSAQAGTVAAAAGVVQMEMVEPGSRPPSAAGGRRRRVGAQKRLHEDTRFGIYDDRRYRAGKSDGGGGGSGTEQPPTQRRRTSSSGTAAAAAAHVGIGVGGGSNGGRSTGTGGPRQRRRRRKPRHLASDFAISDEDEEEDFDLNTELAEAELAEADEAEEEWQRHIKQEQHDVDCVCGVTYDDGEEMIECESCGTWAHLTCLARYGRLRHVADRYICGRCQGFGSPLAAGTPTVAGALSPRGVAVALAARRQAFRAGGQTDSFNNEELYDIAAFLDNMGPQHRLKLERSGSRGSLGPSSARARSTSTQALAAFGCSNSLPLVPAAVPEWGGAGPRRRRGRRAAQRQQDVWPSAGVTLPAPRKRYRLPPPHPGAAAAAAAGAGLPGPLSSWHQMPLVAAGLAAARLSGMQPPLHLPPPPHLPPFMPLGGPPPSLGTNSHLGSPGLPPPATMAAATAAAAAAGMALGRGWGQHMDGGDGGGIPGEQRESQKAATVAELMQIMQVPTTGSMGLPPPRPSLPAAAASALLSSRQPTPSPPIDLMHRDLHDADLQDDLHAQDWLAAAASLARADSQPTYSTFPVGPLDGTGPSGSHHVPSLGGSPGPPPSLPSAALSLPPPVGMQEHHQHWLAVMSSTLQQQQHRGAGRGETGVAAGAAAAAAPHLRPPLGAPGLGLPPDASMPAVHRHLQQLADGVGAAAANATAAAAEADGSGAVSRRQSGTMAGLDAAQQQDGFGRYRQGSLQSLQQLVPELQVEGLHGLTPSASGRADTLMSDDDADVEGPHLLIPSHQQEQEQPAQNQQRQRQQQQQQQQQPPRPHEGANGGLT